jgi:hypothetical protein
MRKNIISVLFVLFTFIVITGSSNVEKSPVDSVTANISTGADTVNIRQMVIAQIENARKKQIQDSLTAQDTNKVANVPAKAVLISQAVVTLKHDNNSTNGNAFLAYVEPFIQIVRMPTEMTIKLAVMGFASIAAFLFVYVRRKKMSVKKTIKRNTKDGIKLIREEKVKDYRDGKLSLIRNKLLNSTSAFLLSKDSVSKNARELNIAKGEIYLAARIKSHELKKASY